MIPAFQRLPSALAGSVCEYHVWKASELPPADFVYNLLLDAAVPPGVVFRHLRTLQMTRDYNQPLQTTLPRTLETLEMGDCFDHPVVLPAQLVTLRMGGSFNQPLSIPASLRTLEIGEHFDQPVVLPAGSTSLSLFWW